jgi:hypothetical protein
MAQGPSGLLATLEAAKHATKNKNTRMRTQVARFLTRAVDMSGEG